MTLARQSFIQILNFEMMKQLKRIGKDLEADDEIRIMAFDNADPDFLLHMLTLSSFQNSPEQCFPN